MSATITHEEDPMRSPVTEEEIREWLTETISEATCAFEDDVRVRTFEDAGLLTGNEGLVIGFGRDVEFQLTIVRSC